MDHSHETGSWTKSYARRGGGGARWRQRWSTCCQMSNVSCQMLSNVKWQLLSNVNCQLSNVICQMFSANRKLDKEVRAARGEGCPLAAAIVDLRRFMLLKAERVSLSLYDSQAQS